MSLYTKKIKNMWDPPNPFNPFEADPKLKAAIEAQIEAKMNAASTGFYLLPKQKPSVDDGMRMGDAMDLLKATRKQWAGIEVRSVLNPDLTAYKAWEIVWEELIKNYGHRSRLPAWLTKRVHQVAYNRLDPTFVPTEAMRDSLLKERPDDRPKLTKPQNHDPFDREFV